MQHSKSVSQEALCKVVETRCESLRDFREKRVARIRFRTAAELCIQNIDSVLLHLSRQYTLVAQHFQTCHADASDHF